MNRQILTELKQEINILELKEKMATDKFSSINLLRNIGIILVCGAMISIAFGGDDGAPIAIVFILPVAAILFVVFAVYNNKNRKRLNDILIRINDAKNRILAEENV